MNVRHAPAVGAFSLVVATSVAAAPLNLGHRGTGTNGPGNPYPENTVVSFLRALAEGADGVELDVMLARDDGDADPFEELVVMHDESLTRTTTCKGTPLDRGNCVASRTAGDIHENCLPVNGAGETAREAGLVVSEERVPTLPEALHAIFSAKPDAVVNIEIKSQPPTDGDSIQELCSSADPFHESTHRVVALLNTEAFSGKESQVLISSFDPSAVRLVEDLAPDLETAYLSVPANNAPGAPPLPSSTYGAVLAAGLGLDGLHPMWRDTTAESVNLGRELGQAVRPWTVNDLVEMRRLIGLGVDALITDEPDVLECVLSGSQDC